MNTRTPFTLGVVLLFAVSCAPLTKPVSETDSAATGPEEEQESPLDRYLQSRPGEEAEAKSNKPWIVVLPMKDVSDFREGVWDIENEFPALLTEELGSQDVWRVVPYDAVQQVAGGAREHWSEEELFLLSSLLRADILLEGTILDYNMERLHIGDPLLAGYKSFSGLAELELTAMRGADLSTIGRLYSKKETTDRDLGLDLFGKPRERDYQYVNLGKMAFGSDEFLATPIGEATVQALVDIADKLSELILPGNIRLGSEPAEILSVYGEEIFINLGSENDVHRGYRFEVFPGPERAIEEGLDTLVSVALVEVTDVVGARVSRVVRIGSGEIASGDRLKFVQTQ
ncbi:MAG: hypothetical protein OXH50_13965 [Gemmatimonadetes bacterium]|nr:hypothetical protein [Gemmatimonadota bacterium]